MSATRLVIALLAVGLVVASASSSLGPLRGFARVLLVIAVLVIIASYARDVFARRGRAPR